MKKMADMISKTAKWLLVFGFVFSQVSFPLEVLADELTENEYDREAILDYIIQESETDEVSNFDLNGDGKVNILDATYYVSSDVSDDYEAETLTNDLVADKNEVVVGDTVVATLYVRGFNQLALHGIEGLLTYDKNVLELVGATLYEKVDLEDDNLTDDTTSGDTTGEDTTLEEETSEEVVSEEETSKEVVSEEETSKEVVSEEETGEEVVSEEETSEEVVSEEETSEEVVSEEETSEEDASEEETEEVSSNLGYLKVSTGKFAYVLGNGYNGYSNDEEVALLTLTFNAIAEGTTEVVISDILESYGELFEIENDSVSVSVTVLENGTGGDVEDDTTTEEQPNEEENEVVVTPVVLSSDYYIKNLVIKGYEINFNMYTYEYNIKVGSDVTSLDFDVLLNSGKSIYYVEGNENFKEGMNIVYLVVKAENGSTKTYTINVEKEKAKVTEPTIVDEDDEEEVSGVSKTIIIILIILVIIGLIYVIFKDDEEDQKQVKKDSQPEKVKSDEKVRVEKVESKNTNTSKKNNTSNKKNSGKNTKKSSKK